MYFFRLFPETWRTILTVVRIRGGKACARSSNSGILHAFTVPKKTAGVCFVADGWKLNNLMFRPPEMLLPKIPQVIDRVFDSSWAALADGKSWFYQFDLHEEIQAFFGVNLRNMRGEFIQTRRITLCMGCST